MRYFTWKLEFVSNILWMIVLSIVPIWVKFCNIHSFLFQPYEYQNANKRPKNKTAFLLKATVRLKRENTHYDEMELVNKYRIFLNRSCTNFFYKIIKSRPWIEAAFIFSEGELKPGMEKLKKLVFITTKFPFHILRLSYPLNHLHSLYSLPRFHKHHRPALALL